MVLITWHTRWNFSNLLDLFHMAIWDRDCRNCLGSGTFCLSHSKRMIQISSLCFCHNYPLEEDSFSSKDTNWSRNTIRCLKMIQIRVFQARSCENSVLKPQWWVHWVLCKVMVLSDRTGKDVERVGGIFVTSLWHNIVTAAWHSLVRTSPLFDLFQNYSYLKTFRSFLCIKLYPHLNRQPKKTAVCVPSW